jgi:hypothetical protein
MGLSQSTTEEEPVGPKLKRKVVIGAAGLAVLAGAGGTYAATRGSDDDDERQAFLNDAAKRLDVSPDKLEEALQGAFFDRLDTAVEEGRLTRSQADAIKARVREKGGPPFLGGGRFHDGRPHGGPLLGGIDAAAKYLDLSEAQLHDELRSGKSLAEVARDRDKSVDGLKEAIEGAVRSRLDEAVADERLTEEQKRRILSDLENRIDAIVERNGGGPPRGGPPPWRHGPRWGDRPGP